MSFRNKNMYLWICFIIQTAFIEKITIKSFNFLFILQQAKTKSWIFQVQRISFFIVAWRQQLFDEEAKVDRPHKGLLVRVGGLRDQRFVLLINTRRKAWLKMNKSGFYIGFMTTTSDFEKKDSLSSLTNKKIKRTNTITQQIYNLKWVMRASNFLRLEYDN
jgi:hypothetical protein